MSNITLNAANAVGSGMNIQQLKQSKCFGQTEYDKVLKDNEGTLTQVYGDDVNSIFWVAYNNLIPNKLQTEILHLFQEKLHYIEKQIDPERLKFTITKAMDDEICINRKATSGGRIKLIINDDGVIAFSFLPDKGNKREKVLDFYIMSSVDFETLAFDFFSF
jgi:hypothetical protein